MRQDRRQSIQTAPATGARYCGGETRVDYPSGSTRWGEHRQMRIIVNGEPRQMPNGATADKLVEMLELRGRRLAMEVNGEIVPGSMHPACRLNEGDRVEIVHAVGGG